MFNQIDADENVRVVILTGEGRSFVAGADIGQMSTLTVAEGRQFGAYGHKVMNFMEKMENPSSLQSTASLWAADASWPWPAISVSLLPRPNSASLKSVLV